MMMSLRLLISVNFALSASALQAHQSHLGMKQADGIDDLSATDGLRLSNETFTCSDGFRSDNWRGYASGSWATLTDTRAECWKAVQAQFPNAEGFVWINSQTCRAMTNLSNLSPTKELAATYPDMQGSSEICVPPCEGDTCEVFEDPHVKVFDKLQVSLVRMAQHSEDEVESGDKWLVKSEQISIQARFKEDVTKPDHNLFVGSVAVGGAFLDNHVFIIGSLEDETTWNGMPILLANSSIFEAQVKGQTISARRGPHSFLVGDLSHDNNGITVKLPFGVELVANRLHNHVNVAIKMQKRDVNQDGLCGNYNGLGADDTLEMADRRASLVVKEGESLFPTLFP